MKGGYRPIGRIQQDLAELVIGAKCYEHLDYREDELVERLLSWLRALFAAMPLRLAEVERWEHSWALG